MRTSFFILLLLCTIFSKSSFAQLKDPALVIDKQFPNSVRVGQGLFTKFGFDIYNAHFYVDDVNTPKRFALLLDYSRKIEKDALIKATIEQLARLGYPGQKTEEWKKQLENIFPSVEKGDQITAIFNPQNGTSFLLGNQSIGRVTGTEFAEAFFGIWLSTKTSSPELRSKLLANRCPPKLIQAQCE